MNLFKMIYNRRIILAIFAVLIISLSNFWIYWVYGNNFLIGELLIIETILLFLSTLFKKNKIISVFTFIILSVLGLFFVTNHFDKNIFSISTMESVHIQDRQQFYAQELGKVYKNRVGIFYFNNLKLIFSKISNNFFSVLDLNLYFATGSLLEYQKYPLFFAPLLIIGFLSLLVNLSRTPLIYLLIVLFISSFTNLDAKLGPLAIFPFISCCITIGLIEILKKGERMFKQYE